MFSLILSTLLAVVCSASNNQGWDVDDTNQDSSQNERENLKSRFESSSGNIGIIPTDNDVADIYIYKIKDEYIGVSSNKSDIPPEYENVVKTKSTKNYELMCKIEGSAPPLYQDTVKKDVNRKKKGRKCDN